MYAEVAKRCNPTLLAAAEQAYKKKEGTAALLYKRARNRRRKV